MVTDAISPSVTHLPVEIQTTSFSPVGGGALVMGNSVAGHTETKIQSKPNVLFQKALSRQCGPGGFLVGPPEILDGGGDHFLIMPSERALIIAKNISGTYVCLRLTRLSHKQSERMNLIIITNQLNEQKTDEFPKPHVNHSIGTM